jgi:hypothetical protein
MKEMFPTKATTVRTRFGSVVGDDASEDIGVASKAEPSTVNIGTWDGAIIGEIEYIPRSK